MENNNIHLVGNEGRGYVLPENYHMDVNLENGMREGRAIVTDTYGMLVAELVYENDKLNGMCSFYNAGILHSRIEYKNDFMDGWYFEYQNNRIYKHCKYSTGVKKSDIQPYNNMKDYMQEVEVDTNHILSICKYDNNYKRQGKGYVFENNRIQRVVEFNNDQEATVLKTFEDNQMTELDNDGNPKYIGGFADKIESDYPRKGRGKEIMNRICLYDGDWIDNKKCGNGISYRNGRAYYNGEWRNNVPHGDGVLYDEEGNVRYEGEWDNGVYEIAPSRWYDYRNDKISIRPRRRSPISFTANTREEIHQVLNNDNWKQRLESLYIAENCGNDIIDQLKISGFQNLVSIMIKKNSLQNLIKLEISDNPKLQTIETENGDGSYFHQEMNTGVCYRVKSVCFKSKSNYHDLM